ncbi:helix-turn-helix domain-containing protein [Aggregatibacter actinomycetemcomitans]|uniref:helix-turn-helix domain-containing protein n=1 Tax=Aggregatibacter actinomycetemcomitans TaxID=714 RepID=UPI00197C3AA4|nr:helix-turn-helix domain-containing protein [Aggregatibacter actinomycetemcomitans]MBN6068564.1 helix-turn-helix domain-containing protein [Aggregatibacter actinomycetemcomitans]MBN6086492.1 helix-turn-helix domain-containing protein [Aggregatibacter actinomycetemcomitans]
MGKHYSIEFKYHIVKLVLDEHWGVREAAQHFHIAAYSSVVVWLQRFEKYGINGLHRQCNKARKNQMPKASKIPFCENPQDIKALLKELEYLRAENAILKKFKELDEQKARQKKGASSTR